MGRAVQHWLLTAAAISAMRRLWVWLAWLCACCAALTLSKREKCDACLTLMEAQQAVWAEHGAQNPRQANAKKFQLDRQLRDRIAGLCNSTLYLTHYSDAMQHGCQQLVRNAFQKLTAPFLQGGTEPKLMMSRKWRVCHEW